MLLKYRENTAKGHNGLSTHHNPTLQNLARHWRTWSTIYNCEWSSVHVTQMVIHSTLLLSLSSSSFPPPPGAADQRVPWTPRSWRFSITHNDAPQLVGLLWTSDQSVAETSTWQHVTLITDRRPCPRRDSNPQSQQASVRRPTHYIVRPLRSAALYRIIAFHNSKTVLCDELSKRSNSLHYVKEEHKQVEGVRLSPWLTLSNMVNLENHMVCHIW
jgi:hypothetical protein